MTKLTKRVVDALTPNAADQFVWDAALPGFGIRVKPSGTKSFIIQYRNSAGRSRRVTLAKFGVMTVEQARDMARSRLVEVARGDDPAEARKQARQSMTVKELCAEYLSRATTGGILTRSGRAKKASTLDFDRGRIDRHIVPLIGNRAVGEVTAADVRAMMRQIAAGKTASDVRTKSRGRSITKGGLGAASRTVGLLGGIFSYAVEEGLRSDNPVRGVKRPADSTRDFRLDEAGYVKLGRRLRAAERAGYSWQIIDIIRLIALTGCRRGEAIALKRSEVDLAGSALRLGDTKTGKSVRPIGREAVALLRQILAKADGPFVFPATKGPEGHFNGLPKAWARIVTRRLPGLTPHGLRHSFASTAEDLGCSIPTIAALLGHSTRGVTHRYIHKVDSALIGSASRVAGVIDALLTTGSATRVEQGAILSPHTENDRG
jgi:integrase